MNRLRSPRSSHTNIGERATNWLISGERVPLARVVSARVIGVIGLGLYNWWVVVAARGTLLTSTSEFFSDLEATGRPDADLLQHLDLVAGLLLLVALLLRGPWGSTGKRAEWPWTVAFSVAGAVGGQFAYACSVGLSAACRRAEWHFDLPLHHYVHIGSGMVEFALMTFAIYLARMRTREHTTWAARAIKWTYVALVVGYPLIAVAYLSNQWGAYVEPIFFVSFSVMVFVELFESSPRRFQLHD
jgi:hypothetical protein